MSSDQHPRVREVLEQAERHATVARDQHKAGTMGMPIESTPRSVSARFEPQKVTIEELDRTSYSLAETQPVVVLRRPDGRKRYFQLDESENWHEVTWDDILRADANHNVRTEAEQHSGPVPRDRDPVLQWDSTLNELLAGLRP